MTIRPILVGLLSLLCLVAILGTFQTTSAQPLPNAAWYLVVYRPENNTLYWINQNGSQAATPRPQLPQEMGYLDMRIAPNGRYGVISAMLSNGRIGLGVYDFQTAQWIQIHQAQEGETIHFGPSIFTSDSSAFAVGFSAGNFETPQWRIILFETQTGNAQLFIDHTHPDSPEAGLSIPSVQYLDDTFVHFQLIPQAVGGASEWPAYKWQAFHYDAALPVISEGPYTSASLDILPTTGEVVTTYLDENLPSGPQSGQIPNFNAVGSGLLMPQNTLTTLYSDATRYQLLSKWAKNGDWILFFSTDATGNGYWNIMETATETGAAPIPLDPQFQDAYGVSDGYILTDEDFNFLFFNELNPIAATRLFQAGSTDKVVYVTPLGATLALTDLGIAAPTVGATPTLVINEPPAADNPVASNCANALTQRVMIGIQARVLPSMGALNVRNQPGGAIVDTLGGATTFNIIGGPVCSEELYWWQIQRPGLQGWLAEGNLQDYYIEPYAGPATGDEPPPAPQDATPTSTNTPAPIPPGPGGFTSGATNTPTPGGFVIVEGVFCAGAPEPRLEVGSNAKVTSNSPMQVFAQAGANATPWQLPKGSVVTIIDGPNCVNDVYYWRFTGLAFNITNSQMEMTSGWIPEGTGSTYWLSPQVN